MNLIPTVFIALMLYAHDCTCYQIYVEAEEFPGTNHIKLRSSAFGEKTVWLKKGSELTINFCLARNTEVRVEGIVYSNDGASDDVSLRFQGNTIGVHTTVGTYNWNEFHTTPGYGNSYNLHTGVYSMTLSVPQSGDEYGVEIDRVVFEVNDSSISSLTFQCKVTCQSSILPLIPVGKESVSAGYILQRSYETQCAEEDNVNIPVFHPSVREYTVTATLPQYNSNKNLRDEDRSNCGFFLNYLYWQFTNIALNDVLSSKFTSKNADLKLKDSPADCQNPTDYLPVDIQVTFSLPGQSEGYIDANIGSRVNLSLHNIETPTSVYLLYVDQTGHTHRNGPVELSQTSPNASWSISDFTWTEDNNELTLQIVPGNHKVKIKEFLMERRPMNPDVTIPILSSSDVGIEGIDVDFWWRTPQTMKVSLENGDTFNNVDFLRITVPSPWNRTNWGQIFVLYQDGNVRLLPTAPLGFDWIPFGTSIIIGQTDHESHRPSAPISDVFITTDPLTLKLTYVDGGSALLSLNPLLVETQMKVSKLLFKNKQTAPFATFRSMYVSDGNTDSDFVLTDETSAIGVMEDWGRLDGKSVRVGRRCESIHLTQSPDITLDITET